MRAVAKTIRLTRGEYRVQEWDMDFRQEDTVADVHKWLSGLLGSKFSGDGVGPFRLIWCKVFFGDTLGMVSL